MNGKTIMINSVCPEIIELLQNAAGVVAAVSGGADSVCLLHTFHEYFGGKHGGLFVAHLNHGVRGAEADRDQEFVHALAGRLDLEFYTEKIDIPSMYFSGGPSVEMLCRRERLAFYERARDKFGAEYVVTGHTLSDQAETVLMRLLRGTSAQGLAGMKNVNGRIVRPLLSVPRSATRGYCRLLNLEFRDDATNTDDTILRNKIRNQLIPLLEKEYNPKIQERLASLADTLRIDADTLDEIANTVFSRAFIRKSGKKLYLDLNHLSSLEDAILSRVLIRAFHEMELSGGIQLTNDLIISMIHILRCNKAFDLINLPGNIFMSREKNTVIFSTNAMSSDMARFEYGFNFPEQGNILSEYLSPPGIRIQAEVLADIPDGIESNPNPWIAYLDFDPHHSEMTIRNWKPGDRFQPLGMKGNKKLQDYFTDEHVSRDEKNAVAVLLFDKRIAWVVGHRIDHRFRVTKKTNRVLFIKAEPISNSDIV